MLAMSDCYLLGAGFSKAICEKAPLHDDLGDEVNNLIPVDLKEKYNFDPKYFELFMTQLDLELKREPSEQTTKTRNKIREHLIKRLNINKLVANDLGSKFVRNLQNDDLLLTLNYDCLLDQILASENIWHPNGGYSQYVNNPLFGQDDQKNETLKNIFLLKLHGSLNFQEHGFWDGADKAFTFDQTAISLEVSKDVFKTLSYGHFGVVGQSTISEYLIIPSYIKSFHPQILSLWNLAIQKVQQIDKFVIIGCGLRVEDTMLPILLMNVQCEKLCIVDLKAYEIYQKIRKQIIPFGLSPMTKKPLLYESLADFLK